MRNTAGDRMLESYRFARFTLLLVIAISWPRPTPNVLGKEVDYKLTEQGLTIKNVSTSCPMIYDNDWWGDTPDKNYLWAKASLGKINLRANIVTRDMWNWRKGYLDKLEQGVKDARKCDFGVMQKEFFDTLSNPAAYRPKE